MHLLSKDPCSGSEPILLLTCPWPLFILSCPEQLKEAHLEGTFLWDTEFRVGMAWWGTLCGLGPYCLNDLRTCFPYGENNVCRTRLCQASRNTGAECLPQTRAVLMTVLITSQTSTKSTPDWNLSLPPQSPSTWEEKGMAIITFLRVTKDSPVSKHVWDQWRTISHMWELARATFR